jgi:hypothetical protein
MEQPYSQLTLGFEFVTEIRAVTSKQSPGLKVDFQRDKQRCFHDMHLLTAFTKLDALMVFFKNLF